MRRWLAPAALLATGASSTGCSLGWRAGIGLSANTEASVGAELFAGAHFGAHARSNNDVEYGAEVEGSIRSKPLRLGLGGDLSGSFRHEPEGKGVGWMTGFYVGLRGLFLAGTLGEIREGVAFALLPTLVEDHGTWKQIGVEVQAGYSTLTDDPTRIKARDDGEFALRLFYEVSTLEGRGFFR